MEHLKLLIQRDKKVIRRIKLLQTLSQTIHHRKSLTISFLSEQLACARPTLREDIEELNFIFRDQLYIDISSKSIVTVEYQQYQTVEVFINMLVKQSLSYYIVDGIFKGTFLNSVETEVRFNVSKAYVIQTMHYINKALSLFDVKLSTKNFQLIGSETNIRLFFFNFYFEFSDLKIIHKDSLQDVAKFITLADKIDPSMRFSHTRLAIWLSILKQRFSQGYFISEPLNPDELIPQPNQYEAFKILFKKTYGSKIPDNECCWNYICALYCISYTDTPDGMRSTYTMEYRREVVEDASRLISEFTCTTVTGVVAFLINMHHLLNISPRFNYVPGPIKSTIQKQWPQLYEIQHNLLQGISVDSPLTNLISENIATSLTAFQVSLSKMAKQNDKVTIIFSFLLEAGFEESVVQDSKKLLKHTDIKAIYYMDGGIVDTRALKNQQPDFIICNHDLQAAIPEKSTVIRLSSYPLEEEWRYCRSVLEEILSKKEHAS